MGLEKKVKQSQKVQKALLSPSLAFPPWPTLS